MGVVLCSRPRFPLAFWSGSWAHAMQNGLLYLVRAHAWVSGSVPNQAYARGNQLMFLSHIEVSVPPFPPPQLPLPKKKPLSSLTEFFHTKLET